MKAIKNNLSKFLFLILISLPLLKLHAQSQQAMNLQAGERYKKADKELNMIYQKILKDYSSKPTFIKKFVIAQRLWVQLRDAELAAKYPEPGFYGSVELMCKAAYLESLTKDRIKFLKVWIDGLEEGDTCIGSVKTKP
ncbi:DUF1311 domain-containing protein [Mucilaginibacter mali]|uniref:DUF1311 domain-containing protein n=1 Tax=Mucilaginibacter mali TaxID=2740462 RepID=A0A7D4UEY4_9SPHI|nr:lysozyme inhibitor LprI family protein [Mucilaginibacter mali]QKJ32139.1 DUF1311 domain-containing protein [Mucilaginibacter mali]